MSSAFLIIFFLLVGGIILYSFNRHDLLFRLVLKEVESQEIGFYSYKLTTAKGEEVIEFKNSSLRAKFFPQEFYTEMSIIPHEHTGNGMIVANPHMVVGRRDGKYKIMVNSEQPLNNFIDYIGVYDGKYEDVYETSKVININDGDDTDHYNELSGYVSKASLVMSELVFNDASPIEVSKYNNSLIRHQKMTLDLPADEKVILIVPNRQVLSDVRSVLYFDGELLESDDKFIVLKIDGSGNKTVLENIIFGLHPSTEILPIYFYRFVTEEKMVSVIKAQNAAMLERRQREFGNMVRKENQGSTEPVKI